MKKPQKDPHEDQILARTAYTDSGPSTTLYLIYAEPDDISNVPYTAIPEFRRLAKETVGNRKLSLNPKEDYHKLIDLDFKFKTLPTVCRNKEVFMLIMVHSAIGNIEKRRSIRETWGRASEKTKLVFLIGSSISEESEVMEELREESNTFSDLVVGSFVDTYKNLTYKHVMGLKYALYYCKEATYILKTDDDVFVNTPALVGYIESNISPYGAENLLMCNVWGRANVPRSFRSLYRFSIKEYPTRTFPTYCSGWFILYSPDVAQDLYKQAQNSKYFWIDDVFITGILAEKSNIPHFNVRNLVMKKRRMDAIAAGVCDRSQGQFLLGRPNIDSYVVRKLWTCAVLSAREIYS